MKQTIRFVGASIIANLFISLGLIRRMKKKALNGEFILSIYFHSPSKQLFEFCIKWLIENKFNFLTQAEMVAISENKLPFPNASVIITVDDGWQTNEENVVKIANKYKIPVTIFVSTDAIENGNYWWRYIDSGIKRHLTDRSIEFFKKASDGERHDAVNKIKKLLSIEREAMTIEQIQNIGKSDFVTLGGHTITHPILTKCEDDKVYRELKDSKIIIENWVDKIVTSFAYPNGDYSEREINYLKELGYAIAYTTKPLYLTRNTLKSIYELPRFCVFEEISKSEAICRMLGVWQRFFN